MLLQAGTLSGNPLAMTAGIKTLQILDRPGTYEYLDKITGRLINGILDAARSAGHEVCGGHISGESCAATQNSRCCGQHQVALLLLKSWLSLAAPFI